MVSVGTGRDVDPKSFRMVLWCSYCYCHVFICQKKGKSKNILWEEHKHKNLTISTHTHIRVYTHPYRHTHPWSPHIGIHILWPSLRSILLTWIASQNFEPSDMVLYVNSFIRHEHGAWSSGVVFRGSHQMPVIDRNTIYSVTGRNRRNTPDGVGWVSHVSKKDKKPKIYSNQIYGVKQK